MLPRVKASLKQFDVTVSVYTVGMRVVCITPCK